jgi:hypothetical protein
MLDFEYFCADDGCEFVGNEDQDIALAEINAHLAENPDHELQVGITLIREDEMSPEPNHEPDDFASNIDDAEDY